MNIKILNNKNFFIIEEKDIYNDKKINIIVNEIKTRFPQKYENYGKNNIIDYAKNMLLKDYFFNFIIKIDENIYVKGEDFVQIIRFDDNQITHRFIGGLYNINLCDKSGNYLNKKLQGFHLSNFK
jgi:hypothetical protein